MSGGAGETGGEARPVLRNTAVLAAARILERIAGALVVLLIAHRLGASDLGLYVGAMGFFALIAIGGELGITTFLVREIAKDPLCTGPYLVHLSVLTAAFSAAAAAAAFGLLPLLGFEPDMREAIAIVLIAVPPAALNAVQRGVFLAYRRTEFEVAVTFVGGVLNVGASAALLAGGYGVESVLVAFVLVQYLSTATYYVLVRRYIVPIRWAFERATARHVLREIRPFAGSSIVAAAFSRPEVIILSAIGTPAQVGYYGAALKVMEFGTLVPQLFMMNVYPVLARAFQRRDGRAQRIQDRAFKFLMIASLPLAALMFAVADPLIDLLYGDGFGEAARLLRILAPGILLACGFSVLWRVLSARGEQGTVLKVQVVTTALELGLGVALIAAFADVGAAVNAVLSGFVLATLLAVYVRRDGTTVSLVRPWWRAGLAAAAAGCACWAALEPAGLVGSVALGVAVYGVLVWVLRALSPDDIVTLRGLLPARFVSRAVGVGALSGADLELLRRRGVPGGSWRPPRPRATGRSAMPEVEAIVYRDAVAAARDSRRFALGLFLRRRISWRQYRRWCRNTRADAASAAPTSRDHSSRVTAGSSP
jgi:O-antigen/teichoic acid export membrane protein